MFRSAPLPLNQQHYAHAHAHHHTTAPSLSSSSAAATAAAFQYLLQQNALHAQQQQQQQQQHAATHAYNTTTLFPLQPSRFGIASDDNDDNDVNDDDGFPTLWYDPEPDENMRLSTSSSLSGADYTTTSDEYDDEYDEPTIEPPPSSTNSLLFEPLELPPKSTGSTGSFSLEQTLKDAFLNYTPEPSPPSSATQPVLSPALLRSLGSNNSSNSNSQRSAGLYNNNGMWPSASHEYAHHTSSSASPPTSNSSLFNALLGFQSAPWLAGESTASSSFEQLHESQPQSQRESQHATSNSNYQSMQKLLLSTTAPSNNTTSGFATFDSVAPLWISTSMLSTPTSQLLPPPPNERKRSNKAVKTRRPRKTPVRTSSTAATALALSLAGLSRSEVPTSHYSNNGAHSPARSVGSDDSESMLSAAESNGDNKCTKGKKCVEPGCARRAQSNSRCKAHGGGARCQFAGPGGCVRSSQGGGFCRAHGGGKRCEFPGCARGQQRKGRCYVHGGIRKCQMGSCEKKDRGNGFCISHGGGKRCEHAGCSRAVRRGLLCQLHESAS